MALESGTYTIFSKLDNAPIGRRNPEPASLTPKGIYKRPSQGPLDGPTVWQVEKLENGNYNFKAIRAVVGTIQGQLFALLTEEQIVSYANEWTLQQDERDTEGNAYVVMRAGQHDGWVAPAEDNELIAIKPILAGLTIPPTFSPSEVFVFKKWEGPAE